MPSETNGLTGNAGQRGQLGKLADACSIDRLAQCAATGPQNLNGLAVDAITTGVMSPVRAR